MLQERLSIHTFPTSQNKTRGNHKLRRRQDWTIGVLSVLSVLVLGLFSCSASPGASALRRSAVTSHQTATDKLDVQESGAPLLRKIADIPMPGGAVRFDYQSLDVGSNRLYISHMNDDHVVVFDVKTQKVIANIPGIPGSTGVLAVPEVSRVFAAASRTGRVAVIDPVSLKVVTRIPAGDFPDGIAYDPVDKKLFVSDETGGADIVIDARLDRPLSTIPLGGSVGNSQYDPASGLVFATVGDKDELAAIDPRTNRVAARYPLPGSDHPHGLYIDAPHRLAFIACEGNARLLVLNMLTMKIESVQELGESPDVLAFDPGLRRLYAACESGIVSVFDVKAQNVVKRGQMFVARKAHSVAVDPRTHLLYLPLENVNGRPVLRVMSPN